MMPPHKPENGSRVRAWDYEFEWTPDHLTAEQLRPMIFSYDELAAKCLDRLDNDLGSLLLPPRANKATPEGSSHPDVREILEARAGEDETVRQLWDQVTAVPAWVDWAQLERGQKVFYRYAGPTVVGLTFQSLLGGLGSARVAETLARAGGFISRRSARRRLFSTFRHLLAITRDVDSIRPPRGAGFASCLRVRLLHALVRRRILLRSSSSSSSRPQSESDRDPGLPPAPAPFPLAQHGVPINDLDAIGTVAAFSAALIWISFPRQGIHLRRDEITDYVALWRYTAHLLGVPTDPFFLCPFRAKATMESLLACEPPAPDSPTSRFLASNMLAALAGRPPSYPSLGFLRAEAHWLNGRAVAAGALGLPPPAWHHTALVAGQCLFLAAACYARRSVPAWDEAGIARMKRVLERVVAEELVAAAAAGGRGGDGEDEQEQGEDGKRGWGLRLRVLRRGGGVEGRNLRAVLVALLVVGWVVWLAVRGVSALVLQIAGLTG